MQQIMIANILTIAASSAFSLDSFELRRQQNAREKMMCSFLSKTKSPRLHQYFPLLLALPEYSIRLYLSAKLLKYKKKKKLLISNTKFLFNLKSPYLKLPIPGLLEHLLVDYFHLDPVVYQEMKKPTMSLIRHWKISKNLRQVHRVLNQDLIDEVTVEILLALQMQSHYQSTEC